ncbi:MAG: FG-GAP repeat protein [Alphaproteobacteria bacterium]|nr:FG-GAP repeat protein [Alphaproteobacteria bacterium]
MRLLWLSLLSCGGCTVGKDNPDIDNDSVPCHAEDWDCDGFLFRDDCDDEDPSIHPGAEERCDGVDQDCDGNPTNGWYLDEDGDGQGLVDTPADAESCESAVSNLDDCDDTRADVYLGAPEVCDGVDNDCDQNADEDDDELVDPKGYRDADGDGYGDPDAPTCDESEAVEDNTDCDDTRAHVHPDADVIPNDGVKNDCNLTEAQERQNNAFPHPRVLTSESAHNPVFMGDMEDAQAGSRLCSVGDLDGDRVDELLVGGPHHGDADSGRAWIARMSVAAELGPSLEHQVAIELGDVISPDEAVLFGYGCGGGDDLLFDDGQADVIVAAPFEGGGIVCVIDGATTGVTIDNMAEEGSHVCFRREGHNDQPGRGYIASGDINGDGWADLMLGAFQFGEEIDGEEAPGRVYVYFGPLEAIGYEEDGLRAVDADFILEGFSGDLIGKSIQVADLVGDARDDVIIGAATANSLLEADGLSRGAVYVLDAAIIAPNGDDPPAPCTSPCQLESLFEEGIPTANVWRLEGLESGQRFGLTTEIGDINGDGSLDLIVGSDESATVNAIGKIHVFSGVDSFTMENHILTETDALVEIQGELDGNRLVRINVPGDLDGDGDDELLVLNDRYDEVYLFYGGPDLAPTNGSLRVSNANVIFSHDPGGYYYYFGSAAVGGHFNDDGILDLAIGAGAADESATNDGAVYVFYGQGL